MSAIAILHFARAHARDAAGPRGRARGAVNDLSLMLGPGVHAVLGAPEDGTIALHELAAGARRPLRGAVTLAGHDPARTASIRARIGALAPEPRLPPASTVRASILLATRARGEKGNDVAAIVDPLGLAGLLGRSPRSLSFAEARAVELALALSTPAPLLLALHEPLADASVRESLVHQRLRDLAVAGACVLVTTSSPSDAQAFADRVHVLHRGSLAREAAGGALALGAGPAAMVELTAWVRVDRAPDAGGAGAAAGDERAAAAPGPRELAAALSRHAAVRGVSWDAAASAGAWPGTAPVRVRGDSAEACAEALIDAALDTGVTIEAIAQAATGLGEVRTATDVLLRRPVAPPPQGQPGAKP